MVLDREWMRGAAPLAVLTLLARRPMYAYELIEALELDSGGILEFGQSTLYPLLYNLQAKGMVKAQWREGDSGRERKYYALTDRGRTRLARETKQWNALAKAMVGLGVLDGGAISHAMTSAASRRHAPTSGAWEAAT